MLGTHGPILKTVCAATLAFVAAVAHRHRDLAEAEVSANLGVWLLLGLVYTQFFEYWVHRVPMHRGLRLLEKVRRNHTEHHRIFHGGNFRTRRAEDLSHIPGRYWIFPLLFAAHYALASAILPLEATLSFLLGCVLHYVAFETSHWFTHVEENALDRFLDRVPLLGSIRSYQIEHHRIHHETPIAGFNFNPPYLGDLVAGAMPRREAETAGFPTPAPPVAVATLPAAAFPALARRRFLSRHVLRYGAALALGVAAVGIAVLAHGWLAETKPPPIAET